VSLRERYDQFLKKVKLFDGLDSYEISKLGRILRQVHFDVDECVCEEG
jgi:hypothetical protein